MLYILTHPHSGDNQWAHGVVDAVKKEFTRRRLEYTEIANVREAIRKCAAHGDPLLIPAPVTAQVLRTVEECNRQGVQVIVPNGFLNIGERYRYHCVKGDFYGAVANVLRGLRAADRGEAAVFGMNTGNQEDVLITDAFIAQNAGMANAVYCGDESVRDCFDRFYNDRRRFKSVICVNDYVAIYFIDRMQKQDPKYLKDICVVSFSNTLLSRLCTTPFTSLAPDMDALGCAVGDIYKLVKRGGGRYQAITIYVGYKIYQRGTAFRTFDYREHDYASYESRDVFFPTIGGSDEAATYAADAEIAHLPRIEMFLSRLTKVEMTILMWLLQGYSNTRISEELFLSGETVRYHLNKMRAFLHCRTREDMRQMLNGLVTPEHIREYLREM